MAETSGPVCSREVLATVPFAHAISGLRVAEGPSSILVAVQIGQRIQILRIDDEGVASRPRFVPGLRFPSLLDLFVNDDGFTLTVFDGGLRIYDLDRSGQRRGMLFEPTAAGLYQSTTSPIIVVGNVALVRIMTGDDGSGEVEIDRLLLLRRASSGALVIAQRWDLTDREANVIAFDGTHVGFVSAGYVERPPGYPPVLGSVWIDGHATAVPAFTPSVVAAYFVDGHLETLVSSGGYEGTADDRIVRYAMTGELLGSESVPLGTTPRAPFDRLEAQLIVDATSRLLLRRSLLTGTIPLPDQVIATSQDRESYSSSWSSRHRFVLIYVQQTETGRVMSVDALMCPAG